MHRRGLILFLGMFTNLWKATVSFVMSVCPSIHPSAWNNSAPAEQFSWLCIFECFQKSVKKIHIWLKSDKNNRYFPWRPMYIYNNISLSPF